jgi:ssDNA thymidine ADP-ribosyltransferase, DarT
MSSRYQNLNPEKALIWRIVHRDNLPWILQNGVHCRNSAAQDPNHVNIGNAELIDKRAHRVVPIAPGGTLSDYVPFYFTPFSPMMYNIKTGYGGIQQRTNAEIVLLVSTLRKVNELGLDYVFTDRHAYTPLAQYFDNLEMLKEIDWPILQDRNFKRDPDDPIKVERYQAEALIHQHLPLNALVGIVCYNEDMKQKIDNQVTDLDLKLDVRAMPHWYFQ